MNNTKTDISIELLQSKRTELKAKLREKADECQGLWGDIVHPNTPELPKTRIQNLLSYADKAAIVFDGAVLGWKLYRRLRSGKKK